MTSRTASAWSEWKRLKADADKARLRLSEAIRQDRADGKSLRELGREIGVSGERVRKLGETTE